MQSLSDVTAVILAGGLGTRLRSVVADRQKVMAQVCGRPFLAFLLDQLHSAGISYTVLCTGYKSEQIEEEFGNSYKGMRLAYSRETESLGTAGAIRLALPLIESPTTIVMNGDSFCDADLSEFESFHRNRNAECSLLLVEVPDTERYGRVILDDESWIASFDEKGAHKGAGWINAGIYLLGRSLIESIPVGRAVSIEREVFPRWTGRGLFGYRSRGKFLDIGTPESYSIAEAFLASRS